MSEELPSREQAIKLLFESQCSLKVIKHCKAVAKLAVETAEMCKENGLNVNIELVEIGALLHDIGRSKTHGVNHAILGAEILNRVALSEQVISIAKRHVGGGITANEAEELGWPKDVYVPLTIEEKIVSYADKLVRGSKLVPVEATIMKLTREGRHAAAIRVLEIHREIAEAIGDR